MKISNHSTDAAAILELGERLARLRLERNLTQRDLAHEAGVSSRTISLVETGRSITLGSFVRILRALGALEALNNLLPAAGPSPMEALERGGKLRERASRPRKAADSPSESTPDEIR